MTYRLYFWFHGAPEDRPGGPWWYRDFDSEQYRAKFLSDVESSLHTFVLTEGESLSVHDPMDIYPPKEERVMPEVFTCICGEQDWTIYSTSRIECTCGQEYIIPMAEGLMCADEFNKRREELKI